MLVASPSLVVVFPALWQGCLSTSSDANGERPLPDLPTVCSLLLCQLLGHIGHSQGYPFSSRFSPQLHDVSTCIVPLHILYEVSFKPSICFVRTWSSFLSLQISRNTLGEI